jgi:hypothetical protein
LPAKIDQGARVIDTRAAMHDYFLLNSDTFAGSSGSGIFDAENALLGVLVRGGYDFVVSPDDPTCVVSSVLPDEPGAMHDWEEATYVKQALDALCGAGYPSERLCGTKGSCGDHYCSLSEDADSCAKDCSAERNKAQDPQVVGEPDPVVEDAGMPEETDAGAVAPVDKAKKPAACSASPTAALESSAGLTVWLSALALTLLGRRRRAR